jgi:hypothetical protein
MTMPTTEQHTRLTLADSDLDWLMTVLQTIRSTYAVSIVHTAHPVSELSRAGDTGAACAIVALSSHDSAMDIRELLERSPRVRFVFVAQALPLRPAVARVIREHGHAVLARNESPYVIAATAAALMAESRPPGE